VNTLFNINGGGLIILFGKDVITVLDFLATKVEITVAEKAVNNNVNIITSQTGDYAGFIDGEFLEPDNLVETITNTMELIKKVYPKRIDRMFVGIPAEFLNYAIKNLKADYATKVVIKKRHIDELFETIGDTDLDDNLTVVSKSPIYYVLDDGVQTNDPEFSFSKNLAVKSSFLLAKTTFLEFIETILSQCGIKETIFVPVPLAIDTMLLPNEVKQNGAIVIDFGYVSTTITSIVGEGIVDMKTFGIGDGHVSADLAEILKLSYLEVEKLKKEVILTLEANPMDNYEIIDENNETKRINAGTTNEIIIARLESFADLINKILLGFQYKQDITKPIYITGSGLVYINGVRNILTRLLGKKCLIIAPKQVEFSKPKFASRLGLINFIFNNII